MGLDVLIVAVSLGLAGYLAFSGRVRASEDWQAMVTPLASIMGSGFLVSAPLLGGTVGLWAAACMAGLLVVAFAVGEAIRYNIRHFEPIEHQTGHVQRLAFLSRCVLSAAYLVSVSYYLQLLASFVLNLLQVDDALIADLITTGLLMLICGIGAWRGLDILEGLERYAVALNLGMIGALVVALLVHNATLGANGNWALPSLDSHIDLRDLRVLLGLLIVVQGFETSRYLGDEHAADVRVRTMRRAQLLSAAIYLVFIGACTVLFHTGLGADVTAIVALTAPIASLLPYLLSLAAVGSQFSAAVADVEGAGGLVVDLTDHRASLRAVYLAIMAGTVGLTWLADVNEIIAYASRAFALFYALQCGVASMLAWTSGTGRGARMRAALFFALALVCLAVVIFGLPAE